ncbi:MAG: DUF1289 domain-containing protein [Aestuariivirga sp.]
MADIETPPIVTPCVKLCVIDPQTGLCIGCARTRDEIGLWIEMGDAARAEVMNALPERMANFTKGKSRRGGRAGRLSRGA